MGLDGIDRRTVLKAAGLAAVAAGTPLGESQAQQAVPNSAGTEPPKLKAPANACDCHMHIYDPRFPPVNPGNRLQVNASVAEYRLLQKRNGTTRTVIVTPAVYVTDNRVTLDAIATLGNSRGGGAAANPGGEPGNAVRLPAAGLTSCNTNAGFPADLA